MIGPLLAQYDWPDMHQTYRLLTFALMLALWMAPVPAQAWQPRVRTFTQALASGDSADFYYPARLRPRRYPIIAFLQGALTDKALYSDYAKALAGRGYIVVVPNRFQSLGPGQPPLLFTTQQVVVDVLNTVKAANDNRKSPLYRLADTTTLGVGGHSLGGAVGLFAVESSCSPPVCFGIFVRPPELKAVALFGTNSIGFDGQPIDVNTSAAPVFLLQGTKDAIATPEEAHQTFDLLETPRGLIRFRGLNHWGITNVQNPPGATPDSSAQNFPQKLGVRLLARWSGEVFDAYLKNDRRARRRLARERKGFFVNITIDD